MAKRIAINGFGRIGRLALRNILSRNDIEVVAVNDLTDNAMLAHLFKYDSAHGPYKGEVGSNSDSIIINGSPIKAFSIANPAELPWADLGVDVVLECTGRFLKLDAAMAHVNAGAKKVLLSAPAKGEGVQTIVMGVNDSAIDPGLKVYSNASCTTNCMAPVVKVLNELCAIQSGTMSTIHAYTADQNIQDAPHKDWRRARAAAANIVPTSTGAAKAVAKVYPAIGNKIFAVAVRVPVMTGSMIDLNVNVERNIDSAEINAEFKRAAENELKGIIQYTEDEIVSSDIVGNQYSSIFDAKLTMTSGSLVKVVAWYDNEAGYAARLADIAGRISQLV